MFVCFLICFYLVIGYELDFDLFDMFESILVFKVVYLIK